MAEREKLIEVKDLQISFGKGRKKFVAVDHVNFDIYKGETFSLVGESGSGKTTIGRAITRINPTSAGEIYFKGKKINGKISRELDREVIKSCQMIFQDPIASIDPRMTVRQIIAEGLVIRGEKDQKKIDEEVYRVLELVGLVREHAGRYPHEFSGGQRQRIGLARAMVMEPELVVADEPISALDVSIRAQVLNLLKKFQREKQVTYLFIAHDLSIVRFISDRIGVIYKGNIVEVADAEELFNFPLHPYTHSLISAIPIPDPQLEKNKVLYTYDPSIHDYSVAKPEFVDIGHNHFVYGNKKEIEEYKALREKGEPLQPITIRKPGEKVKEENHEVHLSKAEDEFLKTPVHDTGSIWYKVLSFFFPIIGIIAAMVYKKKQYYHNYKACKQGALYGFAVLAVILLIFIIALILVVL